MRIDLEWISKKTGEKVLAYYDDTGDFSTIPTGKIKSVCAFCFYDNKLVVVKNEGNWEPVAGHVEGGESPTGALHREVKEESNMKIKSFIPLGYLYTKGEDIYQTRYVCLVEPFGPFVYDPDGGVTEIKLINIEDHNQYINWGDDGARLMSQIKEKVKSFFEI